MKQLTSFIQRINLRRCFTTFYLLPSTLMLCITACSTQKNTGASRAWHELKVIHNVQFNGEMAYKDGMTALNQAHADNFATMLPLYPVSDHQAAESSASSMDKAIEKCRKSIKLHSIKARPKANPKKRNDPKYQNWLKSKEFNSQLYRAWLMLGQSEFHKGDFLGSVGTFRYVERLYENDPNMVALCQLWVARAYGEMGWTYEAEDVLSKVKVDDLKRKNEAYYSAVNADILLKEQRYKEAIPFVKVAKQGQKRKEYLPRFEYVLAQVYQYNQQTVEASSAYKRVWQLHPKDVNMEFNARLHYAELKGDTTQSMKQLRRMAKLYKYRDKQDQLYGTMGNIYLHNGDTLHALSCYRQGIEASTQNGAEKAQVLVQAADLYYDRKDYPNASPYYHEAAQLLSTEHVDYPRVSHRSEILDEVVVQVQIVQLQDSLQRLGHMSADEQLAVVERIIADLKEKERQDSIRLAEQERQSELDAQSGGLQSVDLSKMIGNRTGDAANWYFYNPQLMRSGKQDFMQKWGNRALEDNWRRLSKAVVTNNTYSDEDGLDGLDELALAADSLSTDSTDAALAMAPTTDIYDPAYYLQQIPQTPNDYAASDAMIADAMYQLIYLYRDKIEDVALSNRTFEEFLLRFSTDERILNLYYDRYLTALRLNQTSDADLAREQIITRYPQSTQARIVSDPNYFEALRKMASEQDSLYAATYQAYTHNQFAQVKANKVYAESNYPLTPLMPRLLFLNAISVAKTDGQEPFVASLRDMVQRYPENELSAMAKDMLAMMGQGMESQQGSTTSTLTEQRQQTIQDDADTADSLRTFSAFRAEPSLVYIVISQDEPTLNNLLYEVALFNFSQFLIKDFDMKKIPLFTSASSALEIAGFDSLDEALWYISLIQENADLQALLQQLQATIFPITAPNLELLNHPYTLEEYQSFIAQ